MYNILYLELIFTIIIGMKECTDKVFLKLSIHYKWEEILDSLPDGSQQSSGKKKKHLQ